MRTRPYDPILKQFAYILLVVMELKLSLTAYLIGISPTTLRRWSKKFAWRKNDAVTSFGNFLNKVGTMKHPRKAQPLAPVIPLFPRKSGQTKSAAPEAERLDEILDQQTLQSLAEIESGRLQPVDDLVAMIIEDLELGARMQHEEEKDT